MARYIPENNYLETNYAPIGGFQESMCNRCEAYYKMLYEQGLTDSPFPPICSKSVEDVALKLDINSFSSREEYEDATILMDPMAWAKAEFDWEPRFYQRDMIYCSSRWKLYRLGRRSGKTEAMVVETLHAATTNNNYNILVIAPFERQVTRFFDEIKKFIDKSPNINFSSQTKTPSRINFNNGTKILGFSAGATSGSGSDKIRGQDANLIVIDEIDTLEDEDIDAIMAILASHPDCKLIAATTPRGWRRKFYSYATDKNQGFKEFWFISAESPSWTPETEKFFKGTTDPTTYAQEYLADFAELSDGVFKSKCINSSLQEYSIKEDYFPKSNANYVLGVDWNKAAGTHMLILEDLDNHLRLVKKIIIPESEYMQTDSVDMIIQLNRTWGFKYIFVDKGYGSTQTELLRKHDLVDPRSMFQNKLFSIAMNQHLDVIDPLSGEAVKRNAKHFLVEQTKKMLEDGYLVLPKEEDTTVTNVKDEDSGRMGLVQQMRNFRVEGTSVYGLPKYSQGQDHTLTAYYLAVGGFYWKEGDFKGVPYLKTITGIEISDEINEQLHPTQIERAREERRGWILKRSTGKKYEEQKSYKNRDLDLGKSNVRRGLNNLKNNTRSGGSPGNNFRRKQF